MWLKKISFTALIFFAINSGCFSQNPALAKIDQEDLKRHLTFISSDSLQGRKLGTEVPGLDIAADYIKINAEKNGLKPGVDNYFQNVDIVSIKPDKNSFLEIAKKMGSRYLKRLHLFV